MRIVDGRYFAAICLSRYYVQYIAF